MDLRRNWPTIGLGVLLVLDLVLVVWALWPSSLSGSGAAAGSATSTASASVTSTASPVASESPSPGATAKPSPDAAASPRPLTRLVVAVGENAVWSADVGTCTAPGTVHVSDDRGRSWATRRAEGSVTRIRPDGASTAFVVGGTRRCQLRLWTTADAGRTWNGPRSAAAAWGRSPTDARLVHRPGGEPVTPCPGRSPVLDLVGLDRSDATALCGDGALRRTTDGGARWSTSLTHEGAVAFALSSPRAGVVASVAPTCDGVVVGVLAGDELGSERCVDGLRPVAGEVAVSVAPSGVWLAAADAVLRAEEPGGAFTRVSDWPTG